MITDVIQGFVDGKDLSEQAATDVMEEIMTGSSTDAQVAAFLTALRMKGETADELVGFAKVMRRKAAPVWDGEPLDVVDTCGTGGDRSGTFNISTAAAFVTAGAGARVAKHGNRSVSSGCGSADVMEALGVDIQMPVDKIRRALVDVGIGFLFAPAFHSSMKHVMPARKQIRIRSVFNILGPLANPAAALFQVVGVSETNVQELIATSAPRLGVRHAFVVHGRDGLDEISPAVPTTVIEVKDGEQHQYTVTPEDFGIAPTPISSIHGGNAETNAGIIRKVLEGVKGPHRNAVLMNAAAAIVAAGLAEELKEGFRLGGKAIDSGAALRKLEALRALSAA